MPDTKRAISLNEVMDLLHWGQEYGRHQVFIEHIGITTQAHLDSLGYKYWKREDIDTGWVIDVVSYNHPEY